MPGGGATVSTNQKRDVPPAPPPATVTGARDGVSLNGTDVVLGDPLGVGAHPGQLTDNREIFMGHNPGAPHGVFFSYEAIITSGGRFFSIGLNPFTDSGGIQLVENLTTHPFPANERLAYVLEPLDKAPHNFGIARSRANDALVIDGQIFNPVGGPQLKIWDTNVFSLQPDDSFVTGADFFTVVGNELLTIPSGNLTIDVDPSVPQITFKSNNWAANSPEINLFDSTNSAQFQMAGTVIAAEELFLMDWTNAAGTLNRFIVFRDSGAIDVSVNPPGAFPGFRFEPNIARYTAGDDWTTSTPVVRILDTGTNSQFRFEGETLGGNFFAVIEADILGQSLRQWHTADPMLFITQSGSPAGRYTGQAVFVQDDGNHVADHFSSAAGPTTNPPTIAPDTGLGGAGAAAIINGSDMAGTISFTVGAAPAAPANVVIITFGKPWPAGVNFGDPTPLIVRNRINVAAEEAKISAQQLNPTQWAIVVGAVALTAGTVFGFNYIVMQ